MEKKFSCILLGLLLLTQTGCSVSPIRVAVVDSNRLANRPDIPFYEQAPNSTDSGFSGLRRGSCYRVKYHPSFSENRWMVVEGKLDTGRGYPVVLDTGASPALFVTDVHIDENKLPIYPLNGGGESVGWGSCYLSRLQIGNLKLDNVPCMYKEQHTEIQVFGLPLAKENAIIAGLPLLRQFRYISFDSVNREVEFSCNREFKPTDPAAWTEYKLEIAEDLTGNTFLFVTIPVAGIDTKVQLDTGSGRGLAVGTEMWNRLCNRIPGVKLTKGSELYPYIGLFDCQKGSIAELQIGNRTVQDAQISVFPDNCPLVEDCNGLIGMQYFQDTMIVLDFARNFLWVQNPHNDKKTLALKNTFKEPVLSF